MFFLLKCHNRDFGIFLQKKMKNVNSWKNEKTKDCDKKIYFINVYLKKKLIYM
jgi:hypothetical protein